MKMKNMTVLLPARDEEATIGPLVESIMGLNFPVLVAASACTDNTIALAQNKGAEIVVTSKGKGNAVREALKSITTPYMAMLDSDGTYPWHVLPTIYDALAEGAGFVMCERLPMQGSMSGLHKIGNWCLTELANFLYDSDIDDLCTGMWGFPTETIRRFNLVSTGFTLEAELFVRSLRLMRQNGVVPFVMPITYMPRPDGSKAKLKMWHGLEIGWFLLRMR